MKYDRLIIDKDTSVNVDMLLSIVHTYKMRCERGQAKKFTTMRCLVILIDKLEHREPLSSSEMNVIKKIIVEMEGKMWRLKSYLK